MSFQPDDFCEYTLALEAINVKKLLKLSTRSCCCCCCCCWRCVSGLDEGGEQRLPAGLDYGAR